MAQLVGVSSSNQKVAGLIPIQGTYKKAIDISLSLHPSLSSPAPTPQTIKKCPWVRIKKKVLVKIFIYLFLERGKGKRKRDTSMCYKNINRLSLACRQPGTWPATQTRVL